MNYEQDTFNELLREYQRLTEKYKALKSGDTIMHGKFICWLERTVWIHIQEIYLLILRQIQLLGRKGYYVYDSEQDIKAYEKIHGEIAERKLKLRKQDTRYGGVQFYWGVLIAREAYLLELYQGLAERLTAQLKRNRNDVFRILDLEDIRIEVLGTYWVP